jgi:condensin complex subunit 1
MENLQSNLLRPNQKKILKDHLCHILGIMIKKFNHSYGACVMIIQTLPHYEHFSALYADLIYTTVTQLGYESILPDLLREFHHTNLSSGSNPTTAAASTKSENPNLKFYSQFLIDLADRLAPNLLPYLSLIQDLLDEESYLMRNSILYIYGEIIVRVLNQETTNNDLKLKQMRNELLDTLSEHIHDVNALTRSKTLQIWRRICEENAMPLSYMNDLMKKCIGRMQDMASSVRKSAFQLLCDLIRKNPYGIKSIEMSLEQVEVECAKEEAALVKLNDESDKLIENINKLIEKNEKRGESEEMETNEEEETAVTDNEEDQQKREKHQQLIILQTSKVNYLKDMMTFIKQIQTAIPQLTRLLFSKTQTDVLEVISFFVTCYEHGLVDMLFGIRKMLSLVLYAEKTIKDAVVNAYKRLYLTNVQTSGGNSSVMIAKSLIKLVQDLSVCERDALEELIGEFSSSGELGNSVIKVLWEIFASPEQQPQSKLYALILLSMIIKKIPEKGRANVQVLIDYGLSFEETSSNEASNLDMLRFSETCLALSHIAPDANTKKLTQQDTNKSNDPTANKKDKKSKNLNQTSTTEDPLQPKLQFNNEPFKLNLQHQLFDRISDLIVQQFHNTNTIYWTPFVENAMGCIFKLADNPLIITENIVNRLIEKVAPFKSLLKQNGNNNKQLPPVPLFNEDQSQQTQSSENEQDDYNVDSNILSRFFALLGVIATKLLVFLNQSIVCELKRRKLCKENQSTLSINKKSLNTSKNKRRLSMKFMKSFNQLNPQSSLGSEGGSLEEEMGLQGAEAEDVELIYVETLIESRVAVSSAQINSLLAQFLPFIIQTLKNPNKYSDDQLQLSCALALVKLMVLSPRICNENLQLLFTLIEKSANPNIRSELIVGAGDLVYRFPNALEPWTSHLYLPLRDKASTEVRMNTIRVLSHLILKEMIKTRGQIYEIAICTIDSEQQISSLAKSFFQELSLRNNGLVIYNAMPDIISQLSGGVDPDDKSSRAISEESFRTIVTYLFTFIKKDKQCETLIEKICHAFRSANKSERKCRDLVFCLSKIQLSENGIKKLKETFKWYADKLCIPAVYDTFKQTILKNARKLPMLKNETKMMIDELEKQIEEIRQKGLENEGTATNDEEMPGETNDENNEENDDEEMEQAKESKKSIFAKKQKPQPAPAARSSARTTKSSSSNQKANVAKSSNAKSSKNNTTRTTRRGGRVKVESSSEEEDDDEEEDDENQDEDDSDDDVSTDSD